MSQVLQANIEKGYQQFIDLVARGRNMSSEAVREIAEGRVWTGEDAYELGLIDELGGLEEAIARAAALAEISEWDVRRLRPPMDARSAILSELMQTFLPDNEHGGVQSRILREARSALAWLDHFDDPGHAYAICAPCIGLQL